MDDSKKKEIEQRILQAGCSEVGLTKDRWEQLEAIDNAARYMLARRREAQATMKKYDFTVMNLERTLKELGGKTITDYTIHRNKILEGVFMTYEAHDIHPLDLRELVVELRRETEWLHNVLFDMKKRDAELEDLRLEYDMLRETCRGLENDNEDLLKRLHEAESARRVAARTVTLDLKNKKERHDENHDDER